MTPRQTCSCGRAEVELGCDLCAYCRDDYDELIERECVCGEINTRHCPVHGQRGSSSE